MKAEARTVVVDVGEAEAGQAAAGLLAQASGLSKLRIKDAMAKGAVWVSRGGPRRRLRRATREVQAGERLELFYDPAVLALAPPVPELVADLRDYSVWFKPAGMLSQGSLYGDHCALDAAVERHFGGRRQVFLLHRLDREARGLVLIGHTRAAAAALSKLLAAGGVEKRYRVLALGVVAPAGERICIDQPLDGKRCETALQVLEITAGGNSWLEVSLGTGRKHQIRRHLEGIGHPVMGDPRYGCGNAWAEGLQLSAWSMAFRCPLTGQPRRFAAAP